MNKCERIDKFSVFKETLLSIFRKKYMYDDIFISGNKEFIDGTISVLDFLKEKDHEAYRLVNMYIDGISLKDKFPYININLPTRICFVGKEISQSPRDSYASLLAQQAYYIHLYEKVKRENPRLLRIPEELWCKGRAKKQVLAFRREVLKHLGASDELVEYVNRQIEEVKE